MVKGWLGTIFSALKRVTKIKYIIFRDLSLEMARKGSTWLFACILVEVKRGLNPSNQV